MALLGLTALLNITACATASAESRGAGAAQRDDGIVISSPDAEGMDAAIIDRGIEEIGNGSYGNIHSLLIFRRGKLVSETYFPGEDENNHRGKIGFVRHGRDTLHDIRSVSKTVVALAVLIAHDRGQIKSLDQPVLDYLPEYRARLADPAKSQITIRHALTMTAGLDWNEDVPFSHPDSSAAMFRDATDPLGFVLSRDLVAPPGTKFTYNGGLTQVLAAIVHRASGNDIEQFTKQHLLSPLGIRDYEWAKRSDGQPDADSGLRLSSRDLAKIGLLLAGKGQWSRKLLLPATLVEEAISDHVDIPQAGEAAALGDRQGYGFQIWRFSFLANGRRTQLVELSGNGGQKVYIDQARQLMVVITAGNYDARDLKKSPLDVLIDIVLPSVRSG